jgi:23S rRNA (uracil1939-C5)-methyltransferase
MGRSRPDLKAIHVGQVESLNHDGWGVIRAGKAVFVAGALPGETVEYQLRRSNRSYDEAELVRVVEAAAERVEPPCAHFGRCGGCALQHLAPAGQLRVKDDMLREALRRIGKVEPKQWAQPLVGASLAYRRRARLGARYVIAKERSLVGFRERLSSYVADIERCVVLAEPVNELIAPLAELITKLSIPTRIPQIEVAVGDNACVLVLRVLSPLSAQDRGLLSEFETQFNVRWLIQPGGPDSVEVLQGEIPALWYDLPNYGLRMRFEPSDFIQVNGAMNRLLIDHVVGLLELSQQSQVLDLFCGLGNFTLPIAKHSLQVLGVEGDAGLIKRASANASANNIANAQFKVGNLAGADAAERCLDLVGATQFSHVLLDPPRTGALDILPALAKIRPERLVYVSCHPGTLARDLGVLVEDHGFVLQSAGIADMFAHTSHVESVAVLSGPGASRS